MALATTTPQTDADPFAADWVADPFPRLAEIREQTSAMYFKDFDFYMLTRYDDVRRAADDWQTFSSAEGVALTPEINYAIDGSILHLDPPEHTALRDVLGPQLAPRGLRKLNAQIADYADRLVAEQVAAGEFDAVHTISRVFPINVVADLLGLPAEGRNTLQPGADAMFAAFGPWGDYLISHIQEMADYQEYLNSMDDRAKFSPDGWGAAIMDAIDDGAVTQLQGLRLINGYLTAGMDTTVNAIGAMLRLFAERPEVWNALKADPWRAPAVFEEILRWHSPVVGFWRVATRDVEIGDVTVPAGKQVMLNFAAANHDPEKFSNPEEFQIERNPLDHLAFGYGTHGCAGQGLARMEAHTLLKALTEQIDTIELTGPAAASSNPIVRGFESVPVRVTPRRLANTNTDSKNTKE